MNKTTSRVIRGLQWVYEHASSDFEVASGDKAGAFVGTTEAEVEEALEWLKRLLDGTGK